MFGLVKGIVNIMMALYIMLLATEMAKFSSNIEESKSDRLRAINNLLLCIILIAMLPII